MINSNYSTIEIHPGVFKTSECNYFLFLVNVHLTKKIKSIMLKLQHTNKELVTTQLTKEGKCTRSTLNILENRRSLCS